MGAARQPAYQTEPAGHGRSDTVVAEYVVEDEGRFVVDKSYYLKAGFHPKERTVDCADGADLDDAWVDKSKHFLLHSRSDA